MAEEGTLAVIFQPIRHVAKTWAKNLARIGAVAGGLVGLYLLAVQGLDLLGELLPQGFDFFSEMALWAKILFIAGVILTTFIVIRANLVVGLAAYLILGAMPIVLSGGIISYTEITVLMLFLVVFMPILVFILLVSLALSLGLGGLGGFVVGGAVGGLLGFAIAAIAAPFQPKPPK